MKQRLHNYVGMYFRKSPLPSGWTWKIFYRSIVAGRPKEAFLALHKLSEAPPTFFLAQQNSIIGELPVHPGGESSPGVERTCRLAAYDLREALG